MTLPTTPDSILPAYLPQGMGLTAPPARSYKPERYGLGYETEGLPACVDAAHKAAQWWLNDILHGETARRRWLTLYGKSGCGKTHLAKAAAACLKAHGRHAQCWNWVRLRECLLDGGHPGLMAQVQTLPVLLLDDVGAEYAGSEKSAALSYALLYDLLEARLGRWTFICSNLAPKHLKDARIASRLYRGLNELVDMSTAVDFCLQRKKGGLV